MHDLFTLLSLGQTPQFLYVALSLLGMMTPAFRRSVEYLFLLREAKARGIYAEIVAADSGYREERSYLVVGIYVGFVGLVADNSYWGGAWTADFLSPHSPLRDALFRNGVYPNSVFRQLAGTVSVSFHIKGFSLQLARARNLWRTLCEGAAFGAAYVIVLLIVR
mgnify:FL=1